MNYFLVGFGAVAVAAVGAIDYTEQAHRAGATPGSYGVGAYFATYGARIAPGPTDTASAPEAATRRARVATAPAEVPAAKAAEAAPDPNPTRLEMSGGRSCLDGSGGHFCDG